MEQVDILLIIGTSVFLIASLVIIIVLVWCYCRKRVGRNYSSLYNLVDETDVAEIAEQVGTAKYVLKHKTVDQNKNSLEVGSTVGNTRKRVGNVTFVTEETADSVDTSNDVDVGGIVSAYGDTYSTMVSVSSKANWLSMNKLSNLNLSVQASFIYASDVKYVAGKIIQVQVYS